MEGESNLPQCSRCSKHPEMKLIGNRFECPDCGYGYTIPVKMPSYTELLIENSELRKRIEELTQKLSAKAL